jgi:Protein of unknown function (DUF3306)
MSEPENFIARWSRRKRNAAEEAKAAPSTDPGEEASEGSDSAPVVSGASEPSEAAFDVTKLPPIETITGDTDIRAFLAPGVPAELTRAALRRAWAADPKIRDFVGLSENAWDFNAPGGVAGFGPLEMTDQLREHVMRMLGQSIEGAAADQSGSPERKAQPLRPYAPARLAAAVPEVQRAKLATRAEAAPEQEPQQRSERHDAAAASQRNEGDVAPQPDSGIHDDDQLIGKRLHGRALPK